MHYRSPGAFRKRRPFEISSVSRFIPRHREKRTTDGWCSQRRAETYNTFGGRETRSRGEDGKGSRAMAGHVALVDRPRFYKTIKFAPQGASFPVLLSFLRSFVRSFVPSFLPRFVYHTIYAVISPSVQSSPFEILGTLSWPPRNAWQRAKFDPSPTPNLYSRTFRQLALKVVF